MEVKLNKKLLYLFNEGSYHHAYEIFGSHCGKNGTRFTVWAPDVASVFVVGDFNNWREIPECELKPVDNSGVWSVFVKGAKAGERYKYSIRTAKGRQLPLKADPYAVFSEKRPYTASIIHRINYKWQDGVWMARRAKSDHFRLPKNIYELHLGSWKRNPLPENASDWDKDNNFYSYRQLAKELIAYVKDMGYTHIELMPVMEHPFDGSWGYQTTGYYAASSRYGKPEDLMYLIDKAHRAGIGVILDWAAGHFCLDEHGLAEFNGGMLYENEIHPNWGTGKFDFGRPEVKSFLLSNAMFWINEYHADGIRVDGVSSMLYLNFGIEDPSKKKLNKYGEEGNLEAIQFLKDLSAMVGKSCPGVMMIAEESTAWPMVTYPPYDGGLGFHYKWDMGWMHDTLNYMSTDFPYRESCHRLLSFSMMYAFSENYILPLSHDEVVHGKRSLIGKMPGDGAAQFAGLRLLALYQMTHPGAKLNFMGGEFAQYIEWRFYEALEFFLADKFESHKKHACYIRDLNRLYKKEKALWESDTLRHSFEWIDADNSGQNIISYIRQTSGRHSKLISVINFGIREYESFRVGVPAKGCYRIIFCSDDREYGGGGFMDQKLVEAEQTAFHGREYSVCLKLPALSGIIIKKARK